MQKIVRNQEYRSLHPIFDEVDKFYCMTSEKTVQAKSALIKPMFDSAFRYLHRLFRDYGDCKYDICFTDKQYKPMALPKYDKKNIILLFSGGKDSVAEILQLQKQGYNVYLYHMKRINQSFPNECEVSQALADYMNLPLYIDDIHLSGHHDWMEHPLKNWIIACGALQYGIREGITTKLAVGNYKSQKLESQIFNLCASDTVEFWEAFTEIMGKAIPNISVKIDLRSIWHTLHILEGRKDLLEKSMSCLFPYRWRGQIIRQNEKKFGMKFMPNRCGSCAKCAMEYIYYADNEVLEYNEKFYGHCLQILYNQRMKEAELPNYESFEEFWFYNIDYPMKKSKASKVLKTAEIQNHKIRIRGKKVS